MIGLRTRAAWLWWCARDNFSNLIVRTRQEIREWRDGSMLAESLAAADQPYSRLLQMIMEHFDEYVMVPSSVNSIL